MNKMIAATCLAVAVSAFAQGFGGQQGQGKMEYSEKFADLNYAGDRETFHTLDIYLPKETKDAYPVVIHTYGSAWSMNNQKGSADLNTICAALTKAGYAVVTPNHRSASDAIYPAQLHDLKAGYIVYRYVRIFVGRTSLQFGRYNLWLERRQVRFRNGGLGGLPGGVHQVQ